MGIESLHTIGLFVQDRIYILAYLKGKPLFLEKINEEEL